MKSLPACFLLILVLFSSCRKLVQDTFPDFDPVPVVHSILTEGEPIEVRLSWTAKIDTTRIRFINDAEIRLYADDIFLETLDFSESGLYMASTVAASSVRYRCNIRVPRYGEVTVSDSLPAKIIPYNVQYIAVAGRDEEGIAYPAVRFTFDNDPSEKRWFEVVVYEKSYSINQEAYPGPITDPVLQSEGLPIHLFGNEKIEDGSYTMTVNYFGENYSSGSTGNQAYPTVLELRSVSYDYYRYMRQKYLYGLGFEPEFGTEAPAVNLYSNADNAYGIFAGYAPAVSDTLNNRKYGESW